MDFEITGLSVIGFIANVIKIVCSYLSQEEAKIAIRIDYPELECSRYDCNYRNNPEYSSILCANIKKLMRSGSVMDDVAIGLWKTINYTDNVWPLSIASLKVSNK